MRIVLAYTGGPLGTAAIPWLRDRHRADVIAVTLDLGPGRVLEAARDRALAAGAVRAHVVDAREAFVHDFVLPALRADADDGRGEARDRDALQPAALAHALLGRTLVEIARIERAVAVAHPHRAGRLARVRLESAVQALNPSLTVVPVADGWPESRAQIRAEAAGRGVPLPLEDDRAYVVSANVWGRTLTPHDEGPAIATLPESAWTLTRPMPACPEEPAVVDLRFDAGMPVSINGVSMPLLDLVQSLGTIAGAHGVGRTRRGQAWVEAPAAVVILAAHQALQARVWDTDTRAFASTVSRRYAELVDWGGWFLPLREALDGFVAQTQQAVSGTVRMRMSRSACTAVEP